MIDDEKQAVVLRNGLMDSQTHLKVRIVTADGAIYLSEPTEYYEGGRAFLNHESRNECPYTVLERGSVRRDPDLAKAEAWFSGWDAAWREHMKERSTRFLALPHFPSLSIP
ncbi:hypothetical protein [Sphingomonas sp. TREG-RG-20F-R18-01]|uniref:hypothetical protein n=1 Tax=Sphingomonas sp. TREG-RG-20F-R18-01 TaxID=2914982 RepID=UPI001F59EE56|nr:hypothetical protein [Sphingomonas sp. TREG-RG-20F-R18-01]